MESMKLILTEPVSSPNMLEQLDKSSLKNILDEKKEEIAKDFESVLLNKLLEEMKKSIVDWGQEKDAASKQTEGIFWLLLTTVAFPRKSPNVFRSGSRSLW